MYAFARQKRKQNSISLFKPWWNIPDQLYIYVG
jgi:hypothetical protein